MAFMGNADRGREISPAGHYFFSLEIPASLSYGLILSLSLPHRERCTVYLLNMNLPF